MEFVETIFNIFQHQIWDYSIWGIVGIVVSIVIYKKSQNKINLSYTLIIAYLV